ncbi:hypothetical protein MRX96_001375 [Rhipicephalus microplus]
MKTPATPRGEDHGCMGALRRKSHVSRPGVRLSAASIKTASTALDGTLVPSSTPAATEAPREQQMRAHRLGVTVRNVTRVLIKRLSAWMPRGRTRLPSAHVAPCTKAS